MKHVPVATLKKAVLDEGLVHDYRKYLTARIEFLLNRFQKYPDFPGVQTGYNSITGNEFSKEDIFSYSWINGRGACVFSRFAVCFPEYEERLRSFASHVISAMEMHWQVNHQHFPFMANLDATEKDVGVRPPEGYKSYSDLYACAGFLEFGSRWKDQKRVAMAKEVFQETADALDRKKFVTEPQPTPEDRILENPWSVSVDLANEFVKLLQDRSYLEVAARLITHLLDHYYIEEHEAFVEYITPGGEPFRDEQGRYVVDPGHAIEFCSFCLEFRRLAQTRNEYASLCRRIGDLIPKLILWNLEHGWNKKHPGIYKTIDAISGTPVNDNMPWWILPETMLALVLSYESTRDGVFLELFKQAHNAYFTRYMNPKTSFGPYQNIDGKTGKPVDVVPACKFQDPEYHSGKNLLTITEVIKRL